MNSDRNNASSQKKFSELNETAGFNTLPKEENHVNKASDDTNETIGRKNTKLSTFGNEPSTQKDIKE